MKLTRNKKANHAGFTLVEIMTVIAVIALLLLVAIPSIATIRTQMKVNASKTILNLIGDACEQYSIDHNEFPASSGGMQGRHLLVQALVGYMDKDADGHDGYGWKVPGGRVWGPYNDANEFDTVIEGVNGPNVFIDAFNNYIFYWRFSVQDNDYKNADNGTSFSSDFTIDEYAQNSSGVYYRDDFILATKGPDGKAERVTDNSETDDITNFTQE